MEFKTAEFRPAIIRHAERTPDSMGQHDVRGRRVDVSARRKALKKAWNEITLETLVKIVDNFPKRLKACVDANGGWFE